MIEKGKAVEAQRITKKKLDTEMTLLSSLIDAATSAYLTKIGSLLTADQLRKVLDVYDAAMALYRVEEHPNKTLFDLNHQKLVALKEACERARQ